MSIRLHHPRRLWLGCLALMVAACSPANDIDDPTPDTSGVALPPSGPVAPSTVAGTLRLVSGRLHFVRCGASDDGAALDDGTNGDAAAIVSELGPDNGVTALAEIDGHRLLAVHYAAPEGAPCADLPPAAEVEARGQEPFWYVSVSDGVAIVRTPEELDGVAYTAGQWSMVDQLHWRYEAARGDDALVLELARERCVDGMSGARYPLRATLTRNGSAMSGCGLPGRGAT